jgi:hypothetical protein
MESENAIGDRPIDRRSKQSDDAVREIRLDKSRRRASTEKGETIPDALRFDRDNGDGDRRQEGSLIGRAPIA